MLFFNKNICLFLILFTSSFHSSVTYQNFKKCKSVYSQHNHNIDNQKNNGGARKVKKFRSTKENQPNLFTELKSKIAKTNINISLDNSASYNFIAFYSNYDVFSNLHQNLTVTSISHAKKNQIINVAAAKLFDLSIKVCEPKQKSVKLNCNIKELKPLDFNKVNPVSIGYSIEATGRINNARINLVQTYFERGNLKQQSRKIGDFNILNVNNKFKNFINTWYGITLTEILTIILFCLLLYLVKFIVFLRRSDMMQMMSHFHIKNGVFVQDPAKDTIYFVNTSKWDKLGEDDLKFWKSNRAVQGDIEEPWEILFHTVDRSKEEFNVSEWVCVATKQLTEEEYVDRLNNGIESVKQKEREMLLVKDSENEKALNDLKSDSDSEFINISLEEEKVTSDEIKLKIMKYKVNNIYNELYNNYPKFTTNRLPDINCATGIYPGYPN